MKDPVFILLWSMVAYVVISTFTDLKNEERRKALLIPFGMALLIVIVDWVVK